MNNGRKSAVCVILIFAILVSALYTTAFAQSGNDAVKLVDYTSFTVKKAGDIKLSVSDVTTEDDTAEFVLEYTANVSLKNYSIKEGKLRFDKILKDRFEKDTVKTAPFDLEVLNGASAGSVAEISAKADLKDVSKGTYLVYSSVFNSDSEETKGILEGRYNKNDEVLAGTLLVDFQNEKRVTYFYPISDTVGENPANSDYISYAFKRSESVNIDGNIDEWDENLFQFAPEISRADKTDLSSRIALSWDNDYLYFIEDRTDDKLFFDDCTSADYYMSDNIRIYLSTSDNYATRTAFNESDYVICINPNIYNGKPIIKNDAYDGANIQYDVSGIKTAYREKPEKNGFTAEIAVPFSILQINPKAETELGFQMIIDDSDASGSRKTSNNYIKNASGTYWTSPAGMAKIILKDGSVGNSVILQSSVKEVSYDRGDIINGALNIFCANPVNGTCNMSVSYENRGKYDYTIPLNMKRYNKLFMSVPAEYDGKLSLSVSLSSQTGDVYKSGIFDFEVLKSIAPADYGDELTNIVSKGDTILPSVKHNEYVNSIEEKDGIFEFSYKDGKEDITYKYNPKCGEMSEFTLCINGESFYTPGTTSGIRFVTEKGIKLPGELTAELTEVKKTESGVEASFSYKLPNTDFSAHAKYTVGISGKTLVLDVQSDDACAGFAGGLTQFGVKVDEIAYLPEYINLRLGGNMFLSSYFDWKYGNHTSMSVGGVTYSALDNGEYNPFREKYMITISSDVTETFPNFNNGISPYREEISDDILIDLWGYKPFDLSNFTEMANYASYLKNYGLDDVIFIRHYWQRDGYDMTIPDVIPAHRPYGGDEELIPAGKLISSFGWRFALHTNYTDYSPNYKDFNTDHAIINSTGQVRSGGTFGGVLNNFIKPFYYNYYIDKFEPEITKRYSANASFVDVFGARTPQRDVDYDSSLEGAGKESYVIKKTEEAVNKIREIHNGPFFSEGGVDHVRYAGIIDGVEAQNAPKYLLPDFDLTKVFPLSLNHGMGYYSRTVPKKGSDGLYNQKTTDWYRARQLAYGHQSYVMDQMPANYVNQVCTEYYLMRAIQKQYAKSEVKTIYYLAGERKLNLSDALREKYFDKGDCGALEITYKNGTRIVVNCSDETIFASGYNLPCDSFYAENKENGYVAFGGVNLNGKWGDMSVSDDEVFFSARNNRFCYGVYNIEPKLSDAAFTVLPNENNNGKAELVFDWEIEEEPPKDANSVIIHIIKESDSKLAVATGFDITDDLRRASGHYETTQSISLPDDFEYDKWYDVNMAMYSKATQKRYKLKGNITLPTNLVRVGKFKVVKDGDEVKIISEPYVAEERENAPGDMVDFGKVTADNQFTAKKVNGGWKLTVQPRDSELNLILKDARIERIAALDENSKRISEVEFEKAGEETKIKFNDKEAYSFLIYGDIVWK